MQVVLFCIVVMFLFGMFSEKSTDRTNPDEKEARMRQLDEELELDEDLFGDDDDA